MNDFWEAVSGDDDDDRKQTKRAAILVIIGLFIVIGSFTAIGLSMLTFSSFSINGQKFDVRSKSDIRSEFENRVGDQQITVNGKKYTASDIGIAPNRDQLDEAMSHWGGDHTVSITVDDAKFNEFVKRQNSAVQEPAVDSSVSFNKDEGKWEATDSENGKHLVGDPKAVAESVQAGKEVKLNTTPVAPKITDATTKPFVERLNKITDGAGFYKGEERVVTLSPQDMADMMDVKIKGDRYTMTFDGAALREHVDKLSDLDRDGVRGTEIVDENKKSLDVIDKGEPGYEVNTDKTQLDAKDALKRDSGRFQIAGVETPAPMNQLERSAVVDLSDHAAYIYQDGQLVGSFPIAVGAELTPTDVGSFHVQSQHEKIDMGCTEGYDYCTKDVPWVSFYNGGEGFHGAPWHDNFGNPDSNVSHGCVNMRVEDAETVYQFLRVGSPVTVQD